MTLTESAHRKGGSMIFSPQAVGQPAGPYYRIRGRRHVGKSAVQRSGVQHPAAGPGGQGLCGPAAQGQSGASPAEIVTKLEKHYLAAVMASGAAVGLAAASPGIGTLAALSAVAGETVVFLEATAAFALAVAEVHGIPVEDRDRRRNLVLGVLVGEEGKGAVRELLGSSGPAAPGWPRPNCCRCRWCRRSTPG